MFEHSVKVPRHYKAAANIFRKVSTEGASVKTLLYDDRLRHFRTNVLYALITETIKHTADLDKIFAYSKIFEKESRLDPWLAKVLTTELLFGKKSLPGKSKPEQTILSYRELFEQYVNLNHLELQTKDIRKPRYVRINTNVLTTSDAIRAFQDQGYHFIRCTSGSYSDYLEQICGLTEWDFTQDYHVKTVFVFAAGTKLHDNELYLEKKIILQDKATTLPVHLLAPPTDSIVLDMCSAPGMKTSQLAAYMRNTGRIYAVERDERRYKILCEFLKDTDCKCVEAINKDVLEIKKGDMNDVEYILLDPSCSGSGMDYSLHNYTNDWDRLEKLTSLQEKFLKHAMNSFPNAKRIVYSTCSLYPEENERVVLNVVRSSRAKWRVQNAEELLNGRWNNYGSAIYGTLGTRCLYARPESDLTIGFFVAVLDRVQKDPNYAEASENYVESHEEHNQNKVTDDRNEMYVVENVKVKKKKCKRQEATESADSNFDNVAIVEDGDKIIKKSKKKRKKYSDTESLNIIIDNMNELAVEPEREVPKKKKKLAEEHYEDEYVTEADPIREDVSKKKKRKKDRDAIEVEAIEADSTTKKKKTKKADEIINEVMMDNPEEVNVIPKKKKKKLKDD